MAYCYSPSELEAPSFTYTLDTHTLDTDTIDAHTIDTHTLDTHTLDTHTIDTDTIDTHTIDTHTIDTDTIDTHTIDTRTLILESKEHNYSSNSTGVDSNGPKILQEIFAGPINEPLLEGDD